MNEEHGEGGTIPLDETVFAKAALSRFLRYVTIDTQSDHGKEATPTTEGQWELAKLLAEECRSLGLAETDVELTDHCYVIARLPASAGNERSPVIGFLAHLDTSADVSGKNVKPIVEESGGTTVVRTDGTTLLGADDKAGIAVIMTAAEYLLAHGEIKHGPLEFIFSPDEETGKGLPCFPLEKIRAQACYTLDGGARGEVETECFNAWKAEVRFKGRVIHLGQARGELANAALMAASFAAMLPRAESPEASDGRYGYYCLAGIKGDLETAELAVLIRDFDAARGRERAAALDCFARAVEAQFPGGTVSVESKVQYTNMKDKIDEQPCVRGKLLQAADNLGITVMEKPIRGGTDGSRLTELGIPTPNIFAGGRNFHSVSEWLSVSDMAASCALMLELIRLWA
ncbi:MAG: tripeptide aminopeptidase PepT [Treponema sp.]|jgi:tripeptide aminopeptidase|nr:tripeptide aminopeptidase PepT [Treponema sp.]